MVHIRLRVRQNFGEKTKIQTKKTKFSRIPPVFFTVFPFIFGKSDIFERNVVVYIPFDSTRYVHTLYGGIMSNYVAFCPISLNLTYNPAIR